MPKATVKSLKQRKDLGQKIDDLADIMVQGFDDVRNELRSEFKSEIGGLRTEFHQFRSETRSEFSSIRAELRSIKQEISDIKKRLDYVFIKSMQGTDILAEDLAKIQKQVKKLQKQVAYLEAKTK